MPIPDRCPVGYEPRCVPSSESTLLGNYYARRPACAPSRPRRVGYFTYDEKMQVESVAQAVSNLAIAFGDSDGDEIGMMSRPFGVAILYAG